jgi:hypothetical protein
MTDATCFLVPPEPDAPFDHSRKVECRALVPVGHPRIALTREPAEKIGDMEGMPSRATIRRWIAEREQFRRAYLCLGQGGLLEDILEEINEIADNATNDYRLEEGADGTPVVREKKETIDGELMPIEQHPLYDSVEAWRKVAYPVPMGR